MKRILNLSLKLLIRKKSTKINTILIMVFFLLVLCISIYADSAKNYMYNDSNNSIFFKSLLITVDSKEERDVIKEKVKNIENVDIVTDFYNYNSLLQSKELTTKKLNGQVVFYISTNNTLPKITAGTNFPDKTNNYLVCPEVLYSTDNIDNIKNLSIKDGIDMKKYLDKEIVFTYKSGHGENEYEESYKVIGLYKNNSFFDANICFTQEKQLNRIVKNVFSEDFNEETNENIIESQTDIFVQVDNFNNLSKVEENIQWMGYSSSTNGQILPEYFENIERTTKTISNIILIILFFVILIVLFKQYKDDIKNYTLLSYLGYRKKDILLFSITSSAFQLIIAFFSTLIFFVFFYLLTNIFLVYYPYILNGWKVCISAKSLFIIFGILLLSFLFFSIINYIIMMVIKDDSYNL